MLVQIVKLDIRGEWEKARLEIALVMTHSNTLDADWDDALKLHLGWAKLIQKEAA